MKTLYIEDIPSNYKYARVGNNFIDLFDNYTITGDTLYYRYYYDLGIYELRQENFISVVDTFEINVSNDWHYREDYPSIITAFFVIAFSLILLVNWFTKPIKKGGIIF